MKKEIKLNTSDTREERFRRRMISREILKKILKTYGLEDLK